MLQENECSHKRHLNLGTCLSGDHIDNPREDLKNEILQHTVVTKTLKFGGPGYPYPATLWLIFTKARF